MPRKIKKITPGFLKSLIVQEATKLRTESLEQGVDDSEKIKADEVEAGKLADSIEQDIDFMKALKIHETRLRKKMNQIKEAKKILKKRISEKI
jgi:hypothetical protein